VTGKTFILGSLLFVFVNANAQQLQERLAVQGLTHLEQNKAKKERPKRKGLQKINPLGYLLDAGIITYQAVFSEQLQSDCQYEISCSEYTLRCIRKFGGLRGLLMGLNQLQDCHLQSKYEHETIALNTRHKIKNAFRFKTH
jgi:putative component of membrane protein insertase Oxa1/YidC/SpoIIIJ protein YidD